jgi:hypothetical protein
MNNVTFLIINKYKVVCTFKNSSYILSYEQCMPQKEINWSNLSDEQLDFDTHTYDHAVKRQMQIEQKYPRNFQKQIQRQNKKHFHQKIHPHMRFKLQQR